MAIRLESAEFGVKDTPASPLAPVSIGRGRDPQPTAVWRRTGANRPQDCPIVVIRDLLPLDAVLVAPVFTRTAGETDFVWSVVCTDSVPVVVTPFGVERPPSPPAAQLVANLGRIPGVPQTFETDTETAEAVGFEGSSLEFVACRDITLTWSVVVQQVPTEIQKTRHRLYVILAAPALPWSADFEDPDRWLWPEVLDFACNWAEGATTLDDVAGKITAALFGLGTRPESQGGLRYEGSSHFCEPYFRCGEFLDHLGGTALNSKVNCTDLATIVSTFANAAGGRLYQGQLGMGNLNANVQLISPPMPQNGFFSYHEVAWDVEASQRDRVWDACLAVAGRPPAAASFATYAQDVYRTPAPEITGPAFTTNRPVKARRPAIVTGQIEKKSLLRHPELAGIIPPESASRPRPTLESLLSAGAGVLTAALESIASTAWRIASHPLVQGETAFEARLTEGNEAAAEIRLSVFGSETEARRFALSQTLNISESLGVWDGFGGADFAIGPASGKSILVKTGRIVITGRVALGDFDVLGAMRRLVGLLTF